MMWCLGRCGELLSDAVLAVVNVNRRLAATWGLFDLDRLSLLSNAALVWNTVPHLGASDMK
jgi:hypothetical protein